MIAISSSKPIMVFLERKPYHTTILGLKQSTKLCLICWVGSIGTVADVEYPTAQHHWQSIFFLIISSPQKSGVVQSRYPPPAQKKGIVWIQFDVKDCVQSLVPLMLILVSLQGAAANRLYMSQVYPKPEEKASISLPAWLVLKLSPPQILSKPDVSTVIVSLLRQLTKLKYITSCPALTTPPQKMRLQWQSLPTQYWKHWQYLCMRIPVVRYETVVAARKVWKQTSLLVAAVRRLAPLPTTISYMLLALREVLKAILAVEDELLPEYILLSVTAVMVLLSGVRVASAVQVDNERELVHFMRRQVQGFSKLLRQQVPLVPFLATR